MNVPIDISGVELHTRRLLLRPWRQEDLDDFYEYASVEGVGQMAGWLPHKDKAESARLLKMFMGEKKTFALEFQGKVIGSVGVEKYNEEQLPEMAPLRCREIGYVLSKAYWGRGLMPEAVQAVMAYLFETVRLDAILCGHFRRNSQSARVQQKCGFHFLKVSPYTTRYGTVEDSVRNIIYRKEWEARQSMTVAEMPLTAEAEQILLRMSASWAAENSCRGYCTNDHADLEGNRFFLAFQGNAPIGYLFGHVTHAAQSSTVMAENTPFFEVEELYVVPEMRSHGVGRALFRYAEAAVRGDADFMVLSTATRNWKAILHFYIEELGMEFWNARLFKKI